MTSVAIATVGFFVQRHPRRRRAAAIHDPPRALVIMTADPATTNEDLLRVGRGDREAFSRLYDEVAPMVYGIAARVVRDPARAEEISQEAFLQVWDTADRFDPGKGSAKAWIATITHSRAVDVVGSEQASRRRTIAVGTRSVDPPFDVVAEAVEHAEEPSGSAPPFEASPHSSARP